LTVAGFLVELEFFLSHILCMYHDEFGCMCTWFRHTVRDASQGPKLLVTMVQSTLSFFYATKDANDGCVLIAHKIQFDADAVLNELTKGGMLTAEIDDLLCKRINHCDTHSTEYLKPIDNTK
jgi:hypothetical protein